VKNDGIPCCAADAVRHVRPVEVDGVTVGLAMLDHAFAEVRDLDLSSDAEIRAAVLKRVKVYNYVPAPAAPAYAEALYREYLRWTTKE